MYNVVIKVCKTFAYIVFPCDFISRGVSLDVALEVDIVALLQIAGVHGGPEVEVHVRGDCNSNNGYNSYIN